jgi:MFS family permease
MIPGHSAKTGQADAPPSRVRYGVLAWLCAAALIAYVCRNSIAVAESSIRTDLELKSLTILGLVELTPDDQMGWAMGAFFLTYAVLQLPTGWLGHVWGSRRALPFFALLWSAMTGLMALAGGLPLLLLARLGNGGAQAGIFPCTTATVARWFPLTRRALPNGFLASAMAVGAALGAALTARLLPCLGWRGVFALYSLPGIAWAVLFFLWFRDRPQEHPLVNAGELALLGASPAEPEPRREPIPWAAILTSSAMWWIAGQQFFRAAGLIFFYSWFPTFLQRTRGVSLAQAGDLTSLPLLATVLGSLAGGQLSDWVMSRTRSRRLSRQGVAAGSLTLCALLSVLAFGIEQVQLAVAVISAGMFCAALAGPCAYCITIDLGGQHVTTVFSVMNMAGNVGAFLFPIVVPRLVSWRGWDEVYFLFVGIYLAAALCWLLLKPHGPLFARPTSSER